MCLWWEHGAGPRVAPCPENFALRTWSDAFHEGAKFGPTDSKNKINPLPLDAEPLSAC